MVPVAVGREGNKRSVVAADSGRTMTTGWALEGGPPRRRRRRGPEQRLVAVAAAVGREGSKRSVVAAGVMVVQRKRWIGMKLMMGAEGPVGRR